MKKIYLIKLVPIVLMGFVLTVQAQGNIATKRVSWTPSVSVAHTIDYPVIRVAGKMVIEPQFDDADGFGCGLAPVAKNEKFGYINNKGEVVIDFKFNNAGAFVNGLASVRMGSGDSYREAYIDKTGHAVWQKTVVRKRRNKQQ